MTETARITPDWERIELDYRAGVLSVREIGAARGISHTAINKRAKRDGWVRDLAAKIKAKADALVSKEAVSSQVATETTATERLIVEANAEAIARVRISHRTDISRAKRLCLTLLDELETESQERLTIEELADALHKMDSSNGPVAANKARDAIARAMSLPSRTGSLKALIDSLKTVVSLEREAWGLEADLTPANQATQYEDVRDRNFQLIDQLSSRIAGPAPGETPAADKSEDSPGPDAGTDS